MSISVEFKDAVNEGRVTLVRTMLKNSMVIDPTFNEFNELSAYAEKNINGLYEDHDDDDFVTDASLWDKNYMNKQLNDLMYNFSKKRIKHLKEVCKFIYADRIKNTSHKKNGNTASGNIDGRKVAGATATVGGVGMTVAGFIMEETALAIFGGAIAVIGVAMLIGGSKKN